MIGCFGKKVFEITPGKISTFEKLDFSESLSTENIESTKGKPATYIKGLELAKVNISITLVTGLGTEPQAEVDEWLVFLTDENPQKLILNGKSLTDNKFLLTNVNVSDCQYDNKGKLLFCKVSLTLQEFVKAGQKNDATTTKGAASSPAINYTPKNYYDVNTTSADNKAERKTNIPKERIRVYHGGGMSF